MPPYTISDLEHADINHAIQVADRVWWVGHYQENDIFQCHVYLIEQGDQSMLLDPGMKKKEMLLLLSKDFHEIKWKSFGTRSCLIIAYNN